STTGGPCACTGGPPGVAAQEDVFIVLVVLQIGAVVRIVVLDDLIEEVAGVPCDLALVLGRRDGRSGDDPPAAAGGAPVRGASGSVSLSDLTFASRRGELGLLATADRAPRGGRSDLRAADLALGHLGVEIDVLRADGRGDRAHRGGRGAIEPAVLRGGRGVEDVLGQRGLSGRGRGRGRGRILEGILFLLRGRRS